MTELDDNYTPPATQDDLNRIISDRLARAESKYAGFEDFKAKAAQFDAIKPGDTSATDAKLADLETRLSASETERATAAETARITAVDNARLSVAADKGIAKDLLPLLTATTREELIVQADALLKISSGSGRVPGQGGRGNESVTAGDRGRAEAEKRFGTKQ